MNLFSCFSPGEAVVAKKPLIAQPTRNDTFLGSRCLSLSERVLLNLGKPSLLTVLLMNQLSMRSSSTFTAYSQANGTSHGISGWEAGYVQLWNRVVQDFEQWETSLLLVSQLLVVVIALALQLRELRHVDEDFDEIINKPTSSYCFFYAMVGVPAFIMASLAVGQRHTPPYSSADFFVWACMTLVGTSVAVFYARLYAPCMTVLYKQGWLASRQFLPSPLLHQQTPSSRIVGSPSQYRVVSALPHYVQRPAPVLTSRARYTARTLFGVLLLSTTAGQFALTSSLGWSGAGLWCNLGLALWSNVFESLFHTDSWVTVWMEWPAIKKACAQYFNCLDYCMVLIYSIAHGMLGGASCFIAAQLPQSQEWLKSLAYAALAGDVFAAGAEALIHVLEDRFESDGSDDATDNMRNGQLHTVI